MMRVIGSVIVEYRGSAEEWRGGDRSEKRAREGVRRELCGRSEENARGGGVRREQGGGVRREQGEE